MLILKSSLSNKRILSIQDGHPIGTVKDTICNPNNLKIEGFYCIDNSRTIKVLLNQDIREVSLQGFIVNDFNSLTDPTELIRLKKILDINYDLIRKTVETIDKQKVGKVENFAIDSTNMYVSKLYVSQSILKNFKGTTLSVDRSQILEITDHKIIIENLEKKIKVGTPAVAIQQLY